MGDKIDKKLQERLDALSPEKRELLLKKLREQKKEVSEKDISIPVIAREGNSFELSFAQQRLWFFNQLEPESVLYNLPVAVIFKGAVDKEALRKTFEEIVKRHEILRTTFTTVENQPVQVIHEPYAWELPEEQINAASENEIKTIIESKVSEEVHKLFDLGSVPLLRTKLLTFAPDYSVLVLVSHHIVSDGWSFSVMIQEMNAVYNSLVKGENISLPEMKVQYLDYAYWQKEALQGEELEKHLAFWKEQVEDVSALTMPTDYARPAVQSYRGARYTFVLDGDMTGKAKDLSKKEGATLFMTLLSVYNILLYKYSRQNEFAVGTPIANRNYSEIEPLIGFFVNMLAIRARIEGKQTFNDVLSAVKKTTLEAYSRQDLPFEKLVDEIVTTRDMSRSPIFQVAFVLQTAHTENFNFEGIDAEKIPMGNDSSGFDMTLEFYEVEGKLEGALEYNTDIFAEATIARFAEYYSRLLQQIVDNPRKKVSEYSVLSKEEYNKIVVEWNKTDTDASFKTIKELFEEQVEKKPEQTALVWKEQSLSYSELNTKANRVAHLLQGMGAAPNTIVGLCVEKSFELYIGLLGIVKSGAAYVPMDPDYPKDRLNFMISGKDVVALITERSLEEIFTESNVPRVLIDSQWDEIEKQPGENCGSEVTVSDLLYVIYTSGSTGNPKGVEVYQKNVANICLWHQKLCEVDTSSRMTQIAGVGFDATGLEYWPYFTAGATLYPVHKDIILSPPDLVRFYKDNNITHSFAPTPIAEKLFQEDTPTGLSLRYLLTGGEKLNGRPPEHATYEVIDHYGPAEATIASTVAFVEKQGTAGAVANIGRPLDNYHVYILDEALNPVPVGVPGEIYISGAGIGRGYRERPDLTEERFIDNPIPEDSYNILYKTGDLGRYLEDGRIQFIGRVDFQVKIRGYRIELGEIEALLAEHNSIKEGVVNAVDDNRGEKRLVAYLVPVKKSSFTIDEVKAYLKDKLPDFMVPQAFVEMDALPLTANGKVNRKALPEPEDLFHSDVEYVAPRDAVETELVTIWQDILKIDQVGIHDNFFELGGHSLLATQVISWIRDSFAVELPVRVIFDHSTVAEMADCVKEKQGEAPVEQKPITKINHNGVAELSFAQQRLWFLEQVHSLGGVYSIAFAVELQGTLKVDILEKVFTEIVSRHDSLRTTFFSKEGEPLQKIHAAGEWDIPVVDVKDDELEERIKQAVNKPFDLENGPLFKTIVFKISEEKNVLLVLMHHIISDGWSINVIFDELTSLYNAYVNGKQSLLPGLEIQYVDYAYWQKDFLTGPRYKKQLAYWKNELKDFEELKLPVEKQVTGKKSFTGGQLRYTVDADVSKGIKNLTGEHKATSFMTLFAAFCVLMNQYTGQTDIAVGTPIANRNRKEIEPLIGFFANTLVIRAQFSENQSYSELLENVKQKTLNAYGNQDLPFDKMVDEVQPNRDLNSNPLFETMFAVQNAHGAGVHLEGMTARLLEDLSNDRVRFDFEMHIEDGDDAIDITYIYRKDVLSEEKVSEISEHYLKILKQVIDNPGRKIKDFTLVDENEQKKLLQSTIGENVEAVTEEDILTDIDGMSEEDIDKLLNS